MRNYLKIIVLSFLLIACNDPLKINSPLNKHLNREIKDRILLLTKTTESYTNESKNSRLEVFIIDREINEMAVAINLYDASNNTVDKADKYFTELAIKLNLNKKTFIDLREIDDKSELIISIKMNELKLLDYIALKRSILYSNTSEKLQK